MTDEIINTDTVEQTLEDHWAVNGYSWKSGILYVSFREGAFASDVVTELQESGLTVRNVDFEDEQMAFDR